MTESPIWTNAWAVQYYNLWHKYLGQFKGKPINALEIGSCEGRSSCFFVTNILTHPDSKLVCVDPFLMGTEDVFYHNIRVLGCADKIEVIKGLSIDVDLAMKPWDFIYIDGSHIGRDCLFDMVRSWVSLKKGGIMIVDDMLWNLNNRAIKYLKPKHAVDAFMLLMEDALNVEHIGGQAILRKL
jgi:predicted O-methyltransferase YrrM